MNLSADPEVPSVELLASLLQRLKQPVAAGALKQAYKQIIDEQNQQSLGQTLSEVFRTMQLKGVQVAQLRWIRFDQRRLPALIWHQQNWYLIEHSAADGFVLTTASGDSLQCRETDLEEATVLWLRISKNSRPDSPVFNLHRQPAARLVFKELFRTKAWLRDVLVATLIINVMAVSTSLFAMQVYDRVVPTLAYATLWTLVMGMVIVVSLDWFLKTTRARILDSVSSATNNAVSQQVFDHVMHLQLDSRPRSLGTLAAQIEGLDSVRQFFASSVIFSLIDLPFALMFIVFIGLIGGSIGWVYLALLPVAVTIGLVTQKCLKHLIYLQRIRINERQGMLVDAIRGTETIRSNNASWRFSEQWQEITQSIAHYNIQQKAINNLASVSTGSLATIAYVSALVVGVGMIEQGLLSMGALIACSILGGRVIAPIAQGIQLLSQWQNVSQALKMVDQVLLLNKQRKDEQTLLMPDVAPQQISLEGVRFSYPESPVQQLNIPALQLKVGERVLLVGAVGSGKSTLLKVLAGLYKPSEGRVMLGNADLWETDPDVVTNYVGYLPQSVHLFKGSLRENLALSGVVSDHHLLDISQLLGVDKIAADSPVGMDLPISEGGEGLSGGQQQLVGLARVFIARPKIWLLDEPSAKLDNSSDEKILQAIDKYVRPDDILLIISHRIVMASKLANRVIVMQQGTIVEDGKPEKILPKLMSGHKLDKSTGHTKKNLNRFTQPPVGGGNVF